MVTENEMRDFEEFIRSNRDDLNEAFQTALNECYEYCHDYGHGYSLEDFVNSLVLSGYKIVRINDTVQGGNDE